MNKKNNAMVRLVRYIKNKVINFPTPLVIVFVSIKIRIVHPRLGLDSFNLE